VKRIVLVVKYLAVVGVWVKTVVRTEAVLVSGGVVFVSLAFEVVSSVKPERSMVTGSVNGGGVPAVSVKTVTGISVVVLRSNSVCV